MGVKVAVRLDTGGWSCIGWLSWGLVMFGAIGWGCIRLVDLMSHHIEIWSKNENNPEFLKIASFLETGPIYTLHEAPCNGNPMRLVG